MPALAMWILGGLLQIAGSLVGRALLALGFAWLSYKGVNTTIQFAKDMALSGLSGLPATALGLMSMMKVGEAISIVFSALLVRLTLAGLSQGGSIYRLVRRT